ncbi:fungal-specific transcription factor domain-containing protein [Colletotrichum godetiae]|uniref:Fungal-specific transcription factor domain-containing protein n=1 Tax=Colletotrichum godetiae TaxID=1209918 RepID=A0AAJ0ET31_9PEZI|nr:fungal-specific transcription factor domain-containing protein [Colletotrichum godetiae]KAK1660109.1 fungal-specific transcription factor domain-containing protein [Colletotrichum godetiae]
MQENSGTSALPSYSRPARRSVRSREGCLTCKRRKVKCDESRPRCSHCERLNLECKWRPQSSSFAAHAMLAAAGSSGSGRSPAIPSHATDASVSPAASIFQPMQAVDEIFDYANFLWDAGDAWQQVNPQPGQQMSLDGQVLRNQFGGQPFGSRPPPLMSSPPNLTFPDRTAMDELPDPSPIPDASSQSEQAMASQVPTEDDRLMDYFSRVVVPPILAEVETQKKWLAVRQVVVDMAGASQMVKWSVLAFSNLMLSRREGSWLASPEDHYQKAVSEVATCGDDSSPATDSPSSRREHLLATLFFLSYVDILRGQIKAADSFLKRAYGLFQQGEKSSFAAIEKQFLQWMRLLDARAVSAGGQGLLLSKDDELLLVEASPASFDGGGADSTREDFGDGDIEDVLFQVLYQPGIVFFQKVQSFMGRISKIDPWHRSRGTVEDETEVMNIGAAIAADLRSLYEQRPPLMDYAVSGKLTEPHVSPHLAFVITRAFRTYLANYHASKVHLHRVAYKSFPLTKEANEALNQIRRLARLLVDSLDADNSLPVNMLWPLLMLGSEEQDPQERLWIKTQILRMESVAGNAKITAQVLEEVQARQDAEKVRVDIRSVMHAIFNSCFAIV